MSLRDIYLRVIPDPNPPFCFCARMYVSTYVCTKSHANETNPTAPPMRPDDRKEGPEARVSSVRRRLPDPPISDKEEWARRVSNCMGPHV
jgi:hypothetical protein